MILIISSLLVMPVGAIYSAMLVFEMAAENAYGVP